MVDFSSPEPSRTPRNRPASNLLSSARLSGHAAQRSAERCGMTPDEIDIALNERSVELNKTSVENRSFRVFFEPRMGKFFVGVLSPGETSCAAVTILEQAQYERDRGRLLADVLRVAARKSMTQTQFEQWASAFDWAAQRLSRHDLGIRARYQRSGQALKELQIPVSHPLPSEVLAGGRLHTVLDVEGFLGRVNMDLYGPLGGGKAGHVSELVGFDLMYGPHVVLDMLAIGKQKLVSHFEKPRISRSSLTMIVTYIQDQKLAHTQRTAPKVPPEFLVEEMIPRLGSNDEFLRGVKEHMAKQVPAAELPHALSSICELQIRVHDRSYDLISPDDRTIVRRITELI